MTHSEFMFSGGFGLLGTLITLLVVALGILWVILPFAVFGTKARLDRIIEENQRLNTQLEQLTGELKALRSEMNRSQQI